MADQISILVSRSADQKSITVSDATSNWVDLEGIESLTNITLNFYIGSLDSLTEYYTLTPEEVSEYTNNEEITLTFEKMFGVDYLADSWWQVQLIGNTDEFISNYDGFGVYIAATYDVYENVNKLSTPDQYKASIEQLYWQHICLQGLNYLDVSDAASRGIKFAKRLTTIQKLNR